MVTFITCMCHDIGILIFRCLKDTLIYWYRNDLTISVIRFTDIRKCQIKVHLKPHIAVAIFKAVFCIWDIQNKWMEKIKGDRATYRTCSKLLISYISIHMATTCYTWIRSAPKSMIQLTRSLKRKCQFEEIFITVSTGSYHFYNND